MWRLVFVVQGHQFQRLMDVVTKQDEEAVSRQGHVDSLQQQLAEALAQVSSLTLNLETSQQSNNNAVQVVLQL